MLFAVRRLQIAVVVLLVAVAPHASNSATPEKPFGKLQGFRALYGARRLVDIINGSLRDYGLIPAANAMRRDLRYVVGTALPFRSTTPQTRESDLTLMQRLPRVRQALAGHSAGARDQLINPIVPIKPDYRRRFFAAYDEAAWNGRVAEFYVGWFPPDHEISTLVNGRRFIGTGEDDSVSFERQYAGSTSDLTEDGYGHAHIIFQPQKGHASGAPWRGELIVDSGIYSLWVQLRRHVVGRSFHPIPFWVHDIELPIPQDVDVQSTSLMMHGTHGSKLTLHTDHSESTSWTATKTPMVRSTHSTIAPDRHGLIQETTFSLEGQTENTSSPSRLRDMLMTFSIANGVKSDSDDR